MNAMLYYVLLCSLFPFRVGDYSVSDTPGGGADPAPSLQLWRKGARTPLQDVMYSEYAYLRAISLCRAPMPFNPP